MMSIQELFDDAVTDLFKGLFKGLFRNLFYFVKVENLMIFRFVLLSVGIRSGKPERRSPLSGARLTAPLDFLDKVRKTVRNQRKLTSFFATLFSVRAGNIGKVLQSIYRRTFTSFFGL